MNLPVRFAFLLVFLVALLLRWPLPEPAWLQVDERSFVEFPLGFFGGDLNPHFFNYPTLHFYLCAALDYVWFLCPAPTPSRTLSPIAGSWTVSTSSSWRAP